MTDIMNYLKEAESYLSDISEKVVYPENQTNRIDVYVAPQDIKRAVKALYDHHFGYLITISAYDTTSDDGKPQIGLVYHFGEGPTICSIRTFLPHDHRIVDTICDIIGSATVYERECRELFGIEIVGTPDKSKLLLPEDWPDGVYTMLKSFTGLTDAGKWQKESK